MARRQSKVRRGDSKRVVGYVRVSTEDQHLGPDAQRAALERWCASHGAELVGVYTDLGVSGGAELDKRPALLEAVDAIAEHGAGVLLVAKRDRLARDVMLSAMVERLADRNGAAVQSADGVGEGEGPEALLMRRLVDAFSEYERALIRTRTRAALAVKKGRGQRVGGVPYGYQLAADGRTLDAHEGEQQVLRIVRGYRAEGLTLRDIGQRLEAQGMLPRGGNRWHPQTVARIADAA
jgi:site-specific DNA recombinase